MASSSQPIHDITDQYDQFQLEEEEEGELLCDIVEDVGQPIDDRWCLVGKFLTRRLIDFDSMQNTLASLWQPRKGMFVNELEHNLYIFQFYHEVDIQRVIDGSPWTFNRVTVNIEKPLKRRIKLKRTNGEWLWCHFKYESVPTFCFICGIIGHSERYCNRLFDKPLEEIEKPYGLWMKADPIRRKQKFGAQWLRTGTTADDHFSGEHGFPEASKNAFNENQGDSITPSFPGENQGKNKGIQSNVNDSKDNNGENVIYQGQPMATDHDNNLDIPTLIAVDSKRRRTNTEVLEAAREDEDALSLNPNGLSKNGSLFLKDLVIQKRPKFVFLCETLSRKDTVEKLRVSLDFEGLINVDVDGRSGGIALLWKVKDDVQLLGYSNNYIDVSIRDEDKGVWRLTGCYGEPNRNFRHRTWNLLKSLTTQYDHPWCIISDLNNVVSQEDKKGGNPYPTWLIDGFNEALAACNLCDIDLVGYPYTWERGRGTSNWVEVRLDRALANQKWLEIFNSAKLINMEISSSDHCPILLIPYDQDVYLTKKRFRFENAWLREPMCAQIVKDSWELCCMKTVTEKIDYCGQSLAEWGKSYTGNFKSRIQQCKKEVRTWKKRRDPASIAKFQEAEKELFEVYAQREVFWRQRSKQLWLREGDNNSKYFHASATSRKKNNSISKLRDSVGNWKGWHDGLSDVIINYFDNLFCSTGFDTSGVINNIPSTVTATQNEELLAPILEEEVRNALFQMHPDKAPGPDGMTPGFYQRCWNTVGADIIKLVRDFFSNGELPQGLNDTHMVLIPKVKNPTTMSDLRPISLCNVLYKILSKVLANRLKVILPQLISDNQSAFVPGRLITDNIMISYEVMHYLKRKRRGKEGYMAVSLDFSKAYDRVEWGFLKDMMQKMGFNDQWVRLVIKCVSSVRYTVLNSGREMGPISPKRGIRQGDPLSSYLFLICAEGFSSLIRHFEHTGRIKGCRVANGAPVISHMLFADDSYLYCRANSREASNVISLLQVFEQASGQVVNFDKSSLFFSNNTLPATRHLISQIMGIKKADESSTYLGLPCLIGRNKNAILGFLKDKVQKRIHQWEGRFLSKAGKEVLLKTVAQAFPSYAMSVFLIPLETCHGLESIMSKFWWQSSKDKQGVSWVSWKKMCKHKNAGGLGFRDFRNYNLALLGKQAWRLLTDDSSLVCKTYKARYFPRGSFLTATLGHNPSFIWKSIFESKETIAAGARVRIGNGLNTSILNAPWLPDLTQPFVSSSHPGFKGNTVSGLLQIDHNSWDEEVITDLFNERDKALILSIPLPQIADVDCWFWCKEASGFYSVKSTYRFLQEVADWDQDGGDFWKKFWQIKVPPKVLHFSWRVITGCLPTKVQLQTKHINVDLNCPFCHGEPETIFHVLVQCRFAHSCWHRSAISSGTAIQTDFKHWFVNVTNGGKDYKAAEVLMIAWQIWNARNDILWKQKTNSAASVVLMARSHLNQWQCAQQKRFDPILDYNDQVSDKEHWTKPLANTIKVNVDGAIFEANNCFGFGIIARDSTGRIMEGISKRCCGRVSPEYAEIFGIKEALSWIKTKGWQDVTLEAGALF
uniref:Reverse transcriptase domain-containing protein n=1 Tax=Cannabis sativa TaxID=3483 RepID=A0A803PVR0_CANSA